MGRVVVLHHDRGTHTKSDGMDLSCLLGLPGMGVCVCVCVLVFCVWFGLHVVLSCVPVLCVVLACTAVCVHWCACLLPDCVSGPTWFQCDGSTGVLASGSL